MPSLSAKAEPAVATDPAEMSKAVVVMLEKKIRNLEKRKGRLEEYRTKQNRGQTLSDEQLKAVAKLDDVLSQIDLLQDLIKQITQYGAEVVKQQKRQHKKERFEHMESERKRFGELLNVQTVLNFLGEEETREAFAEGKDGAVKLEEQELNHLDELYKVINPDRSNGESLPEQVRSSSEHLQSVLDARDKAVCGTTYRQLNDIITKVKECSYFTETGKAAATDATEETSTEKEFVVVNAEEVPHADSEEIQSSLPPEVPTGQEIGASVEQTYEQPPAQQQAGPVPQQPPTDPSKTVEEIVENVQGSFNFIQDSVIDVDSPSHVDPAVVSVHQMPAQHFQQQPISSHAQPGFAGVPPMTMVIENSTYNQQATDAAYQQYNTPSSAPPAAFGQPNAHHQRPISEEAPAAPASNQTMFNTQPDPSENEHQGKFGNGMTFESSNLKQQEKSAHTDGDFQQQQRGQGGQKRGGGYRGGRGGFSNGFGGRGGYRGSSDRGGYRGDNRQSGSDRPHHGGGGNNGFNPENRRGGRGGGQRGGNSGGFRGGSSTYSNSGRRGFRGQHQQPPTNA